jgi:hypothetical protein
MILATALGFDPAPTADNTAAWNAMLADSGILKVFFDGTFCFKTAPMPIDRPLMLCGANINASCLVRDYAPSSLTEPFLHAKKTTRIDGISVIAGAGNGGLGVCFDGVAASDSVLRDSYISAKSGAMWCTPLSIQSVDPLGIRGCMIDDVELFAASHHLLWATNVRGLSLNDVNCYPAGGLVDHATIQHSGVGGRSDSVHWITRYLSKLYLYNTDNVTIRGLSSVNILNSGSTNVRQA